MNNMSLILKDIIVYDPKNMELLNDHISKGELKKMISNFDFSKVLTDYSTALLSRKENQCVRKTNLNSTSSSVHVGDNKWEFQTDKYIYPKLLTNIANTQSQLVIPKLKVRGLKNILLMNYVKSLKRWLLIWDGMRKKFR